ncbi:MAG: hypothetical protein QOG87_1193 [Actinomycetota bacterium]|jgi:hypothetical protein
MASRFNLGGRRLRVALIAGGLLGALVTASGGAPAQAQNGGPSFPGSATFNAFSVGQNVSADALQAGDVQLADVGVTMSSAATDSTGLKGIQSETNNAVVPAPGTADLALDPAGDESYGKGSAAEVGLGTPLPNELADQVALASRAEAAALPIKISPSDPAPAGANANYTGLVKTTVAEIPGDPLLYANVLPNEAAAVWSEKTCILGQPISYGRGHAADAELVDAASDENTDDLDGPVVSVEQDFFGTANRAPADSRSFTYLINNGDGTFGVASETRMTFAPVSLLGVDPAVPTPIVVEILGEWIFRATATGKPGGASVSYTVNGPSADPDPTLVRIWLAPEAPDAVPPIEIKKSQLFGPEGITESDIPALPLLGLALGEDERAIDTDSSDGVDPTLPAVESADGTLAAGAADVIRLDALAVGDGTRVAGLRVGHMESKAQVPAGGFKCTIPVSKTGPAQASAGETINWTIKVPSDPDALLGLACDLVNITVKDTIKTVAGNASGVITNISAQGKSAPGNGPTATLSGLGPYKVGDPPIEVTVTARLTGSGRIENTADVTANLANCGQGNLGGTITGFADLAKVSGTAEVLGNATISGSGTAGNTNVAVLAARLPTTGASQGLTMLGIASLLTAAGVYLFNRKVSRSTS